MQRSEAIAREDALVRLIYISRWIGRHGADILDPFEFEEMVAEAKASNYAVGITGALLRQGDALIQVLEGPQWAVENTFESICRDTRHTDLKLADVTPAERQRFPDWMAVVNATAGAESGECLAKKILSLYAELDAAHPTDDVVVRILALMEGHAPDAAA